MSPLIRVIRYVKNNPVCAKIAKDAWGHEWSSASEHIGDREKGLVVGTDKFVKALEKKINRSLKYLPQGRPERGV